MLDMPSIITPMGDISPHAQEGIYLILSFENPSGEPRDMTEASVTFKTPYFTRELTPGAETNQLVLAVDVGEMPIITDRLVPFVVTEDTAAFPHVIWSGKLIMRGWAG